MLKTVQKTKPGLKRAFDVSGFLAMVNPRKRIEFRKGQTLFSQGEAARSLYYVQNGNIKLAVTSVGGKEAVVALLGPGDFLGEGCLVGQPVLIGTATTMTPGSALVFEKSHMLRLLHSEQELSDQFISYMITRNTRTEEDLIDQLFNSTEKRLARTLLLLARYGKPNQALTLPKVSQTVLAEMVGTTRTRVNLFMNKFRKLGFIEYNGTLKINNSLLGVVLRD